MFTASGVVALAVVLSAGPAHAQSTSFTDPVGDGQGVGRSAGMDITSYDIDYAKDSVRIAINFVDLKKGAYSDIVWIVGDGKKNGVLLGVANTVSANSFVEGPDGTDCAGARTVVKPRTDEAVLTFPATCINRLDKIRVQVGAEMRSGDLDWTAWSKAVARG
jgi:hypothetical protein